MAAKEEAAKAAEAAAIAATAEAAVEAQEAATAEAAAEAAAVEGRCDNDIITSSLAQLCVINNREVARASIYMTPCINCSAMTHGDFCPECQAEIDEEISEQDHAIAGPLTRMGGWI